MSTARLVEETWELGGDDAWASLRSCGRRRLLKDAFVRMRFSDGFSHARSLAFMVSLVLVQGVIALVGVATAIGQNGVSNVIVSSLEGAVPGPAGVELTKVVQQANQNAATHQWIALLLGGVGALVTGTTAIGQLERGLNRLYGVEQDRPAVQKYGRALVLALSAGTLLALGMVALAFGGSVGASLHNETLNTAWSLLRWPLAIVFLAGAVTMLFRWCPRRHQPQPAWLAFGAGVSVGLVAIVTMALGWFFHVSPSFGNTYGPLAGVVALLLWAMLSSMGLLFGASVAAQLEAVRAGDAKPQDEQKAEESEPVLAGASS